MEYRSNAKINLYLNVTGLDQADGYHYIDSLFLEIDLCDLITIEPSEGDRVEFVGAKVEGESTVHRALFLFKERFGILDCYAIRVKKNIPIGAGLGGGSSNAACVLKALGSYYGIQKSDIIEVGKKIGSDVPFFFTGGLCHVTGKGDRIRPYQSKLENVYFLLVYPNVFVSTKWAYSLLKGAVFRTSEIEISDNFSLTIDFLQKIIYNIFEDFVLHNNRELSSRYQSICSRLNSRLSFMSGSGSTFVFVYDNPDLAWADKASIEKSFDYPVFFAKAVS